MIHKHLPTFQAPHRLNEAICNLKSKLGLPRANLQLSPAVTKRSKKSTTPESSSTTLGCGFNPFEKYSSKLVNICQNKYA